MKRKTKNSFSAILSTIVVFLTMCLGLSFIYTRTDDFTTGFKSFYVEYSDTKFISDENNTMTLEVGKTYRFKVNSTLDNLTDNERNYKVSVIANPSETYTFFPCYDDGTCDIKSLSDIDLNLNFTFTYGDDYFTITESNDFYSYIESLYGEYDYVDFKENYIYGEKHYFRLVITSLKDAETINIDFNLVG